jgi:hypothetical protein
MVKVLKRALKFAFGPSIGVTIGGVIIPRIMFSNNEVYPPIFIHASVYFICGYIMSFLISLLFEWIRSKANENDEDS